VGGWLSHGPEHGSGIATWLHRGDNQTSNLLKIMRGMFPTVGEGVENRERPRMSLVD
jgi:hypothetical protein